MILKIIPIIILIILSWMYLLLIIERRIERKQLEKNINQYKNTIAGGLENDRINERQ